LVLEDELGSSIASISIVKLNWIDSISSDPFAHSLFIDQISEIAPDVIIGADIVRPSLSLTYLIFSLL